MKKQKPEKPNRYHPFYVYTVRYYDSIKRTIWERNFTSLRMAKWYREKILQQERFEQVGEIYERDIAKPNQY